MKAAIYSRVSTEDQEREGTSLSIQLQPTKWQQRVMDTVKKTPDLPRNEVLLKLKLNVESLYFAADEQGIPLDILIAISASSSAVKYRIES